MRGARCEPEGAGAIGRVGQRRRKRRARGGPNQWRAGGKHARGERTWNIKRMSVTLDVSRLSGWLKFHAACRVERRACEMRGEVRAGRREGVCRAAAVDTSGAHGTRGGLDWRAGEAGLRRRAHAEHAHHGGDAGRVEAHRLVELVRGLPSRKESMRSRGGRGAGWEVRELA